MSLESEPSGHQAGETDRLWWTAVLMVGAIAAFFVIREHWQHLAGYWAYLLLLACPVLHVFHGHGHRHNATPSADTRNK